MPVTVEQLLSFLGVDSVDLDTYVGRYAVIQRDPQPNEEDIRQETDIRMMIVDMEGDPPGNAVTWMEQPWGHFPWGHIMPGGPLAFDFDVYVEGTKILAYAAGAAVWSGGYTGTVTASTDDDPFMFYKVVAQQVAPPLFTTEQVVTVRAVINPPAPYLDTSWDFTVEDLTPPSVIAAEAIDQHTVRLTFDDEMAVEGSGSALLPAAYTVTRLNVDPLPGVDLTVMAVAEVSGTGATRFDLTFQWEQTPGCGYRIDVDPSVTDSSGNGIQ